jgi:translation initiation factor 5B
MIDRVPGWKSFPDMPFSKSYAQQDPFVREDLDNKIYDIIGVFSRMGFKVDRFDRIKEFVSTVAIVPTSAKTGEGIAELIMVLVGLTQQFLKQRLQTIKGPAKGTILEVKEEPGLGLTLNTIIYDGVLSKDDVIVVGGKEKPITTRTRAILVPKPLDEIRDPRDKFSSVDSVTAAAGVKIVAPNLEGVLAGATLYAVPKNEDPEKYANMIAEEIGRIRINTDTDGVVVKTDALGSLEAIAEILKQNNVPIRLADVGDVSKRDVAEAAAVKEHQPLYGAILAFNVKTLPDAEVEAAARGVTVFRDRIIYHVIDEYLAWFKGKRDAGLEQDFEALIKPAKLRIMEGYVFRRAKPAIFGVEVLAGTIKPKNPLIRGEDGQEIGDIQQIQDKGEAVPCATKGMQVAISVEKPMVGRHIFEKDVLYVKVPEAHAKVLQTKLAEKLTPEEQEALLEYVNVMRKKVAFWAA